MGSVIQIERAKFAVGELIHHRLFDYRGVIVDVDRNFQASEAWYEQMARSKPPKNKPWYHVLVHGATHTTYVAEQNLESDDSDEPVVHPMLDHFFVDFVDGRYRRQERSN